MRIRYLISLLLLLCGCSDFDCPDGQARVDGTCRPAGLVDPDPKAKRIILGCWDNLEKEPGAPGFSLVAWELTVDPGRIPRGEPFGAVFKAFAGFNEFFLNVAQHLVTGGVSRVNLLELRATVHVRRGAMDPEPVPLRFDPQTIPWTCRFDSDGREGPFAGPFPSCSEDNGHPDGSNDDCIGLGGKRSPDNRCGQFKDIPTSGDCDPGGDCDVLGDPFPGLKLSPVELCRKNGFCVIDAVEVELLGESDGYVAADTGPVLFGWDDVGTDAELDQTNGPNHGSWTRPPPVFTDPLGPNGLRARAGGEELALECTMAISSWSPFADGSRRERPIPAPDHVLISFPIQEP